MCGFANIRIFQVGIGLMTTMISKILEFDKDLNLMDNGVTE